MSKIKFPGSPERGGYGTRAPITRWVDSQHQMQKEASQSKNLAIRIGMQALWRVALPVALGTATNFVVNHNVALGDDAMYSALYGVSINGGERLLNMLGSSQRENVRRREQRHDSFVHEATRHRVARQNARDKRIHKDGVEQGAKDAQLGSRAGRALDAFRGDGHK